MNLNEYGGRKLDRSKSGDFAEQILRLSFKQKIASLILLKHSKNSFKQANSRFKNLHLSSTPPQILSENA